MVLTCYILYTFLFYRMVFKSVLGDFRHKTYILLKMHASNIEASQCQIRIGAAGLTPKVGHLDLLGLAVSLLPRNIAAAQLDPGMLARPVGGKLTNSWITLCPLEVGVNTASVPTLFKGALDQTLDTVISNNGLLAAATVPPGCCLPACLVGLLLLASLC